MKKEIIVQLNPDFAVQNPPRPLGLGRLIKPRRGLITNAEVIPDFFLHSLVQNVSDDFAALIEKSGINKKFEDAAYQNKGVEYWMARDIQL